MVNTMADLREEVASRLRNSMHGREIDMMESVKPRVPHMLGITPLGKVHDPNNEEMTLLDTKHPFWQDYEGDVRTKNQVMEKIETAIRSLKEDNIFRMTYPYGEEAEVIYVEVDKLQPTANDMKTTCAECGSILTAQPNLSQDRGHYYLKFSIDCPDCDFSAVFEQNLVRR
jgi:hypothetical protein